MIFLFSACVMSNGNLAVFDAVCFSSKPCFTADEVLYKPTMIKFSPDSQHLLITVIKFCYSLVFFKG